VAIWNTLRMVVLSISRTLYIGTSCEQHNITKHNIFVYYELSNYSHTFSTACYLPVGYGLGRLRQLTGRLRSSDKYPTVRARTNRFKNSFIPYAIANQKHLQCLTYLYVFLLCVCVCMWTKSSLWLLEIINVVLCARVKQRAGLKYIQVNTSAGLMPTEARDNYFPEPSYLRETKTYHSQPLESIRHAGNYFVPISIRPIFCCRSYVKLLDYWQAEKNFSTSGGPLRPEARGICHICHMVNPALINTYCGTTFSQ